MISIDFETRSECNIYDTGAYTYSRHPSTEILCLAYAHHNDFEPRLLDKSDILPLDDGEPYMNDPGLQQRVFGLIDHVQSGQMFSAFNSFFEFCIWHNILVKKYGWPSIAMCRWRDTMAKSCTHALPRALANACKALHTPIQKSEDGRRVMLKVCKPRKPTKSNPNKWHEHPEDYNILYDYCLQDVAAEMSLDRSLPEIPPLEQEIWELDQKINWRGIHIDRDAVDAAIALSEEYSRRLIDELQNVTKGAIDRVSRRKMVMDWIQAKGIPITGYTKQDVIDLLKMDLPNDVRRVLEIRQQLGKTSIKKYYAMIASLSDGRIRDTLIYHGASTGRWAGKLVQMHNLPKGSLDNTDLCIKVMKTGNLDYFEMMYPDVMGAISSCIRGMIIAAPGHDLIIADFASIEARNLVWLAGDIHTVKKFHDGIDLYIDMAQRIYRKQDITKIERQLGKTTILACGYGMGAAKFKATCAMWGIDISEEFAQRVIDVYREQYKIVKQMWYDQERAAMSAVETGKLVTCGKVKWGVIKEFLYCQLPSGRRLAYPEPIIQPTETPWGAMKDALTFMTVNAKTNQWVRESTYGGKLTENITQGDFMAEAMLRLESAGYPLILTVHDEIVAEVAENKGNIVDFINRMEVVPKWAGDCPIAAEGWRGKRYRKL